ncbi:hypothetical protein Droror1_Dr00018094 [Drosera rotundifolia]
MVVIVVGEEFEGFGFEGEGKLLFVLFDSSFGRPPKTEHRKVANLSLQGMGLEPINLPDQFPESSPSTSFSVIHCLRGYLLYGPPGTGKSSLIAAMANYLKFDIYDLELTEVRSNLDLRRYLLETANRSILVVEEIDCSVEFVDRNSDEPDSPKSRKEHQMTLSGLLNFIDGL